MRTVSQVAFAIGVIAIAGCARDVAPPPATQPTPISVITLQPPAAVTPADGILVRWDENPKLVVNNGSSSTGNPLVYNFEVATDPSFDVVFSATRVAAGSQQTSLQTSDLAPAVTYYWRAQAIDEGAGIASGFSGVRIFAVKDWDIDGPSRPPILVEPSDGALVDRQPTLEVRNGGNTLGPVRFTFEISRDRSFRTVEVVGKPYDFPDIPDEFTPGVPLASGTTYYWRARSFCTKAWCSSVYSAPQRFTTR